jgi:hypothetical protein
MQGIITASSFFTTPNFHNIPQSAEMPTSHNGIAYEEVQKHKSVDDCWVIIDVRQKHDKLVLGYAAADNFKGHGL